MLNNNPMGMRQRLYDDQEGLSHRALHSFLTGTRRHIDLCIRLRVLHTLLLPGERKLYAAYTGS